MMKAVGRCIGETGILVLGKGGLITWYNHL